MLPEALIKEMQTDITVKEKDILDYLLNHAIKVSKYINYHRKLVTKYSKLKEIYDDLYTEKWNHYRFKYEYSTNTSDANRLTDNDKDVRTKKYELDDVEADINQIKSFIEVIKNKGFALKNYIEYQKFIHGN
jgi:hypothetical protein